MEQQLEAQLWNEELGEWIRIYSCVLLLHSLYMYGVSSLSLIALGVPLGTRVSACGSPSRY